ncbi:DUF4352 domain-containing protein [Actinomadura sp. ATCC 31491]|uniref:DUF4352 domain-containing protein n=1 Tax=Actinomadura luzonensis TaxID=2805427 RepID=A0ABT0FPB4_9ACTN|nr:DUF4352 domain-containing protein [Actinomadura luzonensis]MCK2214174.1 DUF4352 domain-containing protein [Actinomadura luzonensis]
MTYPPPPPPYGPGYGPAYGYGPGPGHPPEPPADRGNLGLILLLAIGLPLLLLSGVGSVYFVLTAGEASVAARQATAAEGDDGAPDVLFDQSHQPDPQDSAPAEPGASGPAASQQATPEQPAQGQQTAALGQALTLTGADPALRVAVTVERLISPATPADDVMKPQPGSRFVGVQMTLANQGQAAYNDSPSNGAELVDAEGRQYRSSPAQVREGQAFAGTASVSTGGTRTGVLVFELPEAARPVTFQFALNSGFAQQKGEWRLG